MVSLSAKYECSKTQPFLVFYTKMTMSKRKAAANKRQRHRDRDVAREPRAPNDSGANSIAGQWILFTAVR